MNILFIERRDPLGSLQLVPIGFHSNRQQSASLQQVQTEPQNLNNDKGIVYSQQNVGTTLRPLIRVPFEAYITITRDSSTPHSISNHNDKVQDSHHEASTSVLPETLRPSLAQSNRNKGSKKSKNTSWYNSYSYFLYEMIKLSKTRIF